MRDRPDARFRTITTLRSLWPLRTLCATFEVTHAGYYAWLKRPPPPRASVDVQLTAAIRRSFNESDRTYGARRVRADLSHAGYRCALHRIERLMRQEQLIARSKHHRMVFDTGPQAPYSIAPNVLAREFTAPAANCKWVADFTVLSTAEGSLYVAAVIDLFSRRVIGWAMHSNMTTQLVTDALLMALWRRGPLKTLLHHSDQGSQYTSEPFQRLLSAHDVTCSMSRNGDCWDNAVMESFFSTLKTERTSRKIYPTRDEAKADVFDYIERFFNSKRRHSTLGYLSPIDYEKAANS